jgi:hypothetical protein
MFRLFGAALAVTMIGGAATLASCGSDDPAAPAATAAPHTSSDAHISGPADLTVSAVALHDGMRQLWQEHILWTRLFIISAVDGLPDKDAVTARLLQNQTDIGKAVQAYYGEAAGAQLTALLRDHILTASALIDAAKAGDKAQTDQVSAKWYQNANDIADFLSGANPAWSKAEMRTMMKDHLDLTLKEAVARITKDYAADVAAYDAVEKEILAMSDMLASGIVSQFPAQFS